MDRRPLEPRAGLPLAPLTTLGVGGPAQWFATATASADIPAAHAWAADRRLPLCVFGGGSNVVVSDAGVPGLVLQVAIRRVGFDADGDGTLVTAGAGEPWDGLVARVVDRGLGGIECLSGIPGLVGGTPIQNVGAYGQEVGDTIERVTAFDRHLGGIVEMRGSECGFAYRTSRFKTADADRFIISEVRLRLHPAAPAMTYPDLVTFLQQAGADRPSLQQARSAVLAIRRRKGMVLDPADPDTKSVGSFFMNPVIPRAEEAQLASAVGVPVPAFVLPDDRVKVPAAWLIERAGFGKGYSDGPVGISSKHPLALINRGGADARDVLRLAVNIKRRVMDRFGIVLRPEPVFVGFDGDPAVEFLQRA